MVKIIGARTHNLQGISLELPQNALTVLTGLSGSGKSSLAIDTIAAEGMRRFLAGLSPRLHTLFSKTPRPDVDAIENLPPTVAIAYRGEMPPKNVTVASLIGADLLLHRIFAYHGLQHSPTTGKPLRKFEVGEMADEILKHRGKLYILAPLESITELEGLGYTRALVDGKEWDLSEEMPTRGKDVLLVIDRLTIKEGVKGRLLESLTLAVKMGKGVVKTWDTEGDFETYSTLYLDGSKRYSPLTPAQFHKRTPQALACKINGLNIEEVEALSADELLAQIDLFSPLQKRLKTLSQLGLGYLTLDRMGNTLSAGELQRVQLTSQLANHLTGLLLVLDEPTRGLHRSDVDSLLTLLRSLQAEGNTLLIVEHEPQMIRAADHVVELSNGALSFQGTPAKLLTSNCITGRYLSGKESPPSRPKKPKPDTFVHVKNASCHNIQNLSVDIPLNRLVAFCGVSGSGKSSLLLDYLLPRFKEKPPAHLERVIAVDQDPLGLTPRSIPATAIGLMTPLRTLLSQTPLAKARGLTAAHFSLAKPGGRCERCQGRGTIELEMAFLPGATTTCDLCSGARYNAQTLEVTWKGYSPADILNLTAEEAFALFSEIPKLADRLVMMTQLGLGYLTLGQPLPTLSGGEVQRLKLVGQLAKQTYAPTLYILDEPSSGLHLHDLSKLLEICYQLIAQGHTVWVIEHHLKMIHAADWVIELG